MQLKPCWLVYFFWPRPMGSQGSQERSDEFNAFRDEGLGWCPTCRRAAVPPCRSIFRFTRLSAATCAALALARPVSSDEIGIRINFVRQVHVTSYDNKFRFKFIYMFIMYHVCSTLVFIIGSVLWAVQGKIPLIGSLTLPPARGALTWTLALAKELFPKDLQGLRACGSACGLAYDTVCMNHHESRFSPICSGVLMSWNHEAIARQQTRALTYRTCFQTSYSIGWDMVWLNGVLARWSLCCALRKLMKTVSAAFSNVVSHSFILTTFPYFFCFLSQRWSTPSPHILLNYVWNPGTQTNPEVTSVALWVSCNV